MYLETNEYHMNDSNSNSNTENTITANPKQHPQQQQQHNATGRGKRGGGRGEAVGGGRSSSSSSSSSGRHHGSTSRGGRGRGGGRGRHSHSHSHSHSHYSSSHHHHHHNNNNKKHQHHQRHEQHEQQQQQHGEKDDQLQQEGITAPTDVRVRRDDVATSLSQRSNVDEKVSAEATATATETETVSSSPSRNRSPSRGGHGRGRGRGRGGSVGGRGEYRGGRGRGQSRSGPGGRHYHHPATTAGRGGQGRGRGRGRGRSPTTTRTRSQSPIITTTTTSLSAASTNHHSKDSIIKEQNDIVMIAENEKEEQGKQTIVSPFTAASTAPNATTATAAATTTTATEAETNISNSSHHIETTSSSITIPTDETNPVLQLPPIPAHAKHKSFGKKGGVPMILSRKNTPQQQEQQQSQDDINEQQQQHISERLAEAALVEEHNEEKEQQQQQQQHDMTKNKTSSIDNTNDNSKETRKIKIKKKKKDTTTKSKKKKDKQNAATAAAANATAAETSSDTAAAAEAAQQKQQQHQQKEQEVSTTDALHKLPAQQVSITATTAVKVLKRNDESNVSLGSLLGDNKGNNDGTTSKRQSKIAPQSKKSTKRGKNKKGLLANDDAANQKAARRFNNDVRLSVERGDPALLRAILQDKRNHKFALDAVVLETVMKAYIMAALFEDALYCLRNCTLPATLAATATERILQCLPQNLRNSSAYTAADMINALCIATQFDDESNNSSNSNNNTSSAMALSNQQSKDNNNNNKNHANTRTYFLRIVRGIALEFLEEATSARDRICSSPCERLVRSAVCVVNARLKRGKKPGELVVEPGDQLGVFVPDTMENRGIQAGDAVSILPYAGPYPMSAESLDRNMVEATVTNTNPMVLRLQDRTNADLYSLLTDPQEGNVYRIDKLANRMGFNRQLAAAVAIASPLGESRTRDPRRPCPQLIKAITAMDENIDRVMRASNNGRLPRGEMTSTAALCAEAIPWNVDDESEDVDQDSLRASSRLALEKYGALEGLNASQCLAVEGAISNRLTLVQGPPGTGKTAVAIRILQHWARLAAAAVGKGENATPILATSDSNIAVDNLVEGCASVGLRVVRLGRPEAIRPELLRYCIDRPTVRENGVIDSNSYGSSSVVNFKERAKQLKSAQIICCTCIGSGGDILDALGPLERVLVDEATQATEPAVLVPLMRGCRQLVLVGDHCQLPPTVLSTKAEEEGHGVPLFSRMVACGVPPFMLDTQYRMHPAIAMFPSDLFYGGLLKNGVSAPERRPLAGFPWPREEFPVAFMSVHGTEMDDGVSKYNEDEANAAFHTVQLLLEGGQCGVSDIAVVTPYAAQARLIRRMLRTLQRTSGPPFIEVSSVDGFQGREKEAVVFSAVRCNDYGAIGFTSDWRRVNVSFTRARRALIVIGSDHTLRRGDPDTWGSWLSWAEAYGLNMDRPGQPRGRYDAEQLRRVRGGTTAAEMLKDVLERQQAQLKTAQQQQERAIRNAEGHIIATAEESQVEDASAGDAARAMTLEEDLAMLENTEGNWDDSDDEGNVLLRHSVSKGTLTSASSSADLRSATRSSTPTDAWDL